MESIYEKQVCVILDEDLNKRNNWIKNKQCYAKLEAC